MEIQHNSIVNAIIELSDLRIVTGDQAGYITLFTIDYENEQWTKIAEEKAHATWVHSFCELSDYR